MQELVSLQGESGSESVVTTSNLIAEVFGKEHRNVLRAIDNLLPQLPEDTLRNFAHTDFIEKKENKMQENVQLTLINDQATVTSIQIAEHFHKRHADVIRAIDNLECSPEFHERNFALMVNNVEIGSGATRQDKAFTLTRDGFAFLCMGFTGKDAAQWKERYIAAFNAMEKEVQRLQAENEALLKWNLTNCHGAITTLQDDNGGGQTPSDPAVADRADKE